MANTILNLLKLKLLRNRYSSICLILLFIGVSGFSQTTVTGTVVSKADDLPLPGVNILEKGTTNGVVSDFDGKFSIEVAEDAIIEFTYVGFKTKDVAVDGQTTIN